MMLAVLLTHQHHGSASTCCASSGSLSSQVHRLDRLLKEMALVLSTSMYAPAKRDEEIGLVGHLDGVKPEEF